MKAVIIETTMGRVQFDPRQFVGLKPCTLNHPLTGGPVEGVEILVTLGAIPVPLPDGLRKLAELFEEAARPALVIPTMDQLPPLKLES